MASRSDSDRPAFIRLTVRIYEDEDPVAYRLLSERKGARRPLYHKHLIRQGALAEIGGLGATAAPTETPMSESPRTNGLVGPMERMMEVPILEGEFDPDAF